MRYPHLNLLFGLLIICVLAGSVAAQTLSGTIMDDAGNPLPFAAIYFPDRKGGTATNENGLYSIRLGSQRYTVVFQYLGFETRQQTVDMRNGDVELNIQMQPQPIELKGVTVTSDREDPAYTIMRKAIAKAKYHTQQIDSFSAQVYVKGSGRLKGVPGLFRRRIEKELAKEGIDTSTSFTTESVSIIGYQRPNTYTERVISVRTVGNDNDTGPGGFIQGSFYEPEINGSVSPLSPRAFAYYRFEYLGDFTDRGHLINKIKVTPRSRGDNVFEGTIFIVDQLWSIHSLDLKTYIWGILFEISQLYQPIEDKAWLPVNNVFDVSGSFFGFKFEYKYFANSTDYYVELNPVLDFYVDVIDEKLEREAAKAADADFKEKSADKTTSAIEKLGQGEELSRKELRKVLKEYEKEERREYERDTLQDVVSVTRFEVDSMAGKRDSIYWESMRPIPLTEYELKGYQVRDSMARVELAESEAAADSVDVAVSSSGNNRARARKRSSFRLKDVILGGEYRIGGTTFTHKSPLLLTHFNTVDGFHTGLHFELTRRTKSDLRWEISPQVRYAFTRQAFNWNLRGQLTGGPRFERWAAVLEGGNSVFQLNRDNPVDPYINDIWSLFFEENYLKVYERDYVYAAFQKSFSPKLRLHVQAEWSQNRHLENNSNFKIFNNKNRTYTSNTPYNAEIGDTEFPEYKATTINIGLRLRPWSRFIIRNGRKRISDNNTPTFTLDFKYGIPDALDSDVDYSQLEASVSHVFTFPAGGVLNLNLIGGIFLHNDDMYFPEFKHFAGSQIPFATLDPVSSFRSLEYYGFSTSQRYISAHAFYQFRKLLATRLLEVRLTGAKEGIFINALETPTSNHYLELGYGLNYIFRVFRIELVSSWQDFKYTGFGVRFGLAANLETLFN